MFTNNLIGGGLFSWGKPENKSEKEVDPKSTKPKVFTKEDETKWFDNIKNYMKNLKDLDIFLNKYEISKNIIHSLNENLNKDNVTIDALINNIKKDQNKLADDSMKNECEKVIEEIKKNKLGEGELTKSASLQKQVVDKFNEQVMTYASLVNVPSKSGDLVKFVESVQTDKGLLQKIIICAAPKIIVDTSIIDLKKKVDSICNVINMFNTDKETSQYFLDINKIRVVVDYYHFIYVYTILKEVEKFKSQGLSDSYIYAYLLNALYDEPRITKNYIRIMDRLLNVNDKGSSELNQFYTKMKITGTDGLLKTENLKNIQELLTKNVYPADTEFLLFIKNIKDRKQEAIKNVSVERSDLSESMQNTLYTEKEFKSDLNKKTKLDKVQEAVSEGVSQGAKTVSKEVSQGFSKLVKNIVGTGANTGNGEVDKSQVTAQAKETDKQGGNGILSFKQFQSLSQDQKANILKGGSVINIEKEAEKYIDPDIYKKIFFQPTGKRELLFKLRPIDFNIVFPNPDVSSDAESKKKELVQAKYKLYNDSLDKFLWFGFVLFLYKKYQLSKDLIASINGKIKNQEKKIKFDKAGDIDITCLTRQKSDPDDGSCEDQEQQGGGSTDPYYHKYLKYKQKYLDLKSKM